jgi:L-lactate utilization protein LutB
MKERDCYWLTRMKRVKQALERNGIKTYVAKTGDEARRKALSLIRKGATVGIGGSRTSEEIGLLDALRSGDYCLYDQYAPGLNLANSYEVRKEGTHAEYFVSGSNAITDDGKIVNIDGMGNRLAGFCFGTEKVIIVAGRNKIVADVDAAIDRVRNVAAPMNARRFGLDTPCVKSGKCSDCASPERICNLTLIIEKQKTKGRTTVILINKDLGF